MEMLRYADELRDPAEYFDEVPSAKPQKDMVDLAVQLVEKKSGAFDPTKFEDHYGTALKELAEEKTKGHTVVAKEIERPAGGNVVDLMEALKRSIEGTAPSKGKSGRGGKKRA
jgi:DNA end-binding protein Ku